MKPWKAKIEKEHNIYKKNNWKPIVNIMLYGVWQIIIDKKFEGDSVKIDWF